MCGILLHFVAGKEQSKSLEDELIECDEQNNFSWRCSDNSIIFEAIVPYVKERGPNYSSLRVSKEHSTSWFSSVLSLREPFTSQSVDVADRFILQFNGELYNADIKHNDTQYIASLLNTEEPNVFQIIRMLDGEFAYTIYDKKERTFFFGRDPIGRRSLSYRLEEDSGELFIASVTGKLDLFQDCIAGIIYTYRPEDKILGHEHVISKPFIVSEDHDDKMENLDTAIDTLYKKLETAVEKRVKSIHPMHIENTPISILFSGGLDCSVIAALVCEQIKQNINPSSTTVIELLNVGFENPRTGIMPKDTPDRKLAKRSGKILQDLYPEIDIKIVEIDVSYEEYLQHKPRVIDLMYPKNTEMDLSIAIAFYFASMGSGSVSLSHGCFARYQRKGLVLFSGLGADELYGGYHKLANKSRVELKEELTKQINNIYDRNLNRDDKVIACNGVEVRYPFLDENVVEFSTRCLPLNYKINKHILRRLASEKLHLKEICNEPKRAIQFGTKSAKMTKDCNRHGTDVLK